MYGGGVKGIMGTVSGSAHEAGAKVTGIVPYAMVNDGAQVGQANGEVDQHTVVTSKEPGREVVRILNRWSLSAYPETGADHCCALHA